jgi:zinc transporter ZupT
LYILSTLSVEVIKDLDSAVTGDNLIANWRRILLLVLAITVHNIPEGLAVGVSFGAASLNKTESSSFENARSLAIGIGVQNFPEGIAVSLPLKACGYSNLRAFWYNYSPKKVTNCILTENKFSKIHRNNL